MMSSQDYCTRSRVGPRVTATFLPAAKPTGLVETNFLLLLLLLLRKFKRRAKTGLNCQNKHGSI